MEKKIHKDFHGALSVGFEFLSDKYGEKVLEEYLVNFAENIYGELIKKIKKNGIVELENYWRKIFTEEEGKFSLKRDDNKKIELVVEECPAISHMKKVGYKIYRNFCIQCEVINRVISQKTGFISEITYDVKNGKCKQIFQKEERT
ncbi:MAG TPA: hypothetical protein P5150_00310 [Candidatus Ratteibacteria bacterium]|nr:hypothetical protein [Candidatus Ratteibacteria bacterium]